MKTNAINFINKAVLFICAVLITQNGSVSSAYGSTVTAQQKGEMYTEVPDSAYNFHDSLGVCAHITVYKTHYGNKEEVRRQLRYLDIKYVRDDVRGSFEKMLETYKYFAQDGIKFDTVVRIKDVPDPTQFKEQFKKLAPYVVSFEGANEVDNLHRKIDFEPEARKLYEAVIEHQYRLYNTVKSIPETRNIPVYNFTAVMEEHSDSLRTLLKQKLAEYGQPITDFDNVHAYDQTGLGSEGDAKKYIDGSSLLPDLPKVLTETGYTTIKYNDQNARKGGKRGVSPDVSAKLLLNTIVDAYKWGVKKTYIYQLEDDVPDPENLDKEAHFGLFDFQNTPKPAAIAIHNMRLILQEELPSTSSFKKNEPFSWWVEQTNHSKEYDFEQHHLVLQRGAKTKFIIAWAEPKLWDPQTHAPVTSPIAHQSLTLGFPSPMQTVRIYDPLKSEVPQAQLKNVDKIQIEIVDHPIIVEIKTP